MTCTTDLAPGAVSSADHGGAETQYNTVVSVRGMKSSALFSKRSQRYNPCSDPASYLESCIASVSPNCRPVCSFSTKPVITGKPFPHIFTALLLEQRNVYQKIPSSLPPYSRDEKICLESHFCNFSTKRSVIAPRCKSCLMSSKAVCSQVCSVTNA